MSPSGKKTFNYEKAVARLEEIIEAFDEGGLPLDKMEAYFIEGMDLVKQCSDRLDTVETRVTRLLTEQNGEWSEAPFDEPEGEDGV